MLTHVSYVIAQVQESYPFLEEWSWENILFPELACQTIIFYSRPARLYPFSFGHAFVCWRETKDGQIIKEITYGFYPVYNNGKKSLWLEVKGGLLKGYMENRSNSQSLDSIVVWVSERTFQQTLEKAQKMNDSTYRLLKRNCVNFLAYIAKEAGLKTPALRNAAFLPKLPATYLKQLARKNKGKKLNKRGYRIHDPTKIKRIILRFALARRKR
ncbi:MAG: hypothetical protein RML72_04730 [Bacteroidia bacterium]|nr:hypothetical protein [Bacteroidia bacterium]MDW8158168.1 hypothetical protein [Bacteroidia bacterium]